MRLRYSPLLLFVTLFYFSSCVENADFDQINLDVEPVLITPLVFLELNQNDFLDDTGTVEIETLTDLTDLDAFQGALIQENLLRVDFQFEIRNSFDRKFLIEIELLSSNNTILYNFQPLQIESGDRTYSSQEVIRVDNNPNILETSKVRVTITLIPGSNILDPDVQQSIEFRSTGRFYLRI